jgi:AP2 domain
VWGGLSERERRSARRSPKSGYTGVTFHKQLGQWAARVTTDGQRRHLGVFPTPEAAAVARAEALRSSPHPKQKAVA